MEKRFNWRVCALTSAVVLLGSLANFQAYALGLGRITVQSALGEPLRAEIDIADINAGEASSLRTSVASADVFRAAGMEYSSSVSDLQISLQKRADGRFYLRLNSTRAVTEPFVDLILEASWSSGRIVRDYTMLFDPPNSRQPANVAGAITAPVLTRPAMPATAAAPAVPPAAGGVGGSNGANGGARPPPAQVVARPAPVAKAPPVKIAPTDTRTAVASGQQFAVKPGDTAGKIAAQLKPASISLDQMLLALLRSNPDAFIDGNINRLRSGSVLEVPDADAAGAVSAADARTTIAAQSRNFNDFRRKLAENIPATQVGNSNREASGKVQAKVQDNAPVAVIPDKLTLSKGAVKTQSAAEDKIAKDRQAKDDSDRVAQLTKNISDLNKLSGAPGVGGAAASASTAKGAGIAMVKPDAVPAALPSASSAIPAPTPAPVMAPASAVKPAAIAMAAPAVSASAPATPVTSQPAVNTTSTTAAATAASAPEPASVSASVAGVSASVPVSAASQTAPAPDKTAAAAAVAVDKKPVAVAPAPPPEPSLLEELTENPLVLPGLALLLLLLAGFGFYRYRQRNNNPAQVDSSFLESRLQPDSFFGASGGQRVDTSNDAGATGSSLVYSPSQLDSSGDVDPVAEADVYLAYGRDLQAEEILKEALRTTPSRVAIHAKLMEIYAKRRDVKAFEVIALQAFKVTGGEGPEWDYIGEMGRKLDPANVLYQPGGQPATVVDKGAGSVVASAAAFSADTIPVQPQPQYTPAMASKAVDLDLDFSLDDEPAPFAPVQLKPSVQPPEPAAPFKPEPAASFDAMDMDFDMDMDLGTAAAKPEIAALQASLAGGPGFDKKASDDALSASGLTFTNEPFAPVKSSVPAAAVMDHGMLEFDMGSLSLDLDGPTTESPAAAVESSAASPAALAEGPLDTKFALAEEFRALGDLDGARSLAEEVLAHATGSLKSKAQAFLNALY